MKARATSVLLCLLSALVEVHPQTAPYISFMGNIIPNHGYVDLNTVGTYDSIVVHCYTDLTSCCSHNQGPNRGDWYFPNGAILPVYDYKNVYEGPRYKRVMLLYTGINGTSGIYRCDIETIAVSDDDRRETVYVGLYTSGGKESVGYVRILNVINTCDRRLLQLFYVCVCTFVCMHTHAPTPYLCRL